MLFSKIVKYILLGIFLVMLYYSSSAIGSTNYMIVFSLLVIPVALKSRYFNDQGLLLLCFSFFYLLLTLFNREIDSKDIYGYLICPFSFFSFGRYIVVNFSKPPYKLELFFLLTIISTSIIFYYYSYLDFMVVGVENTTRKLIIEGTVDKNATYYGLVGSVGLAGISVFIYQMKFRQNLCLYGLLLAGILSILSIMHLVNRTGLFLVASTLLLLLVYKKTGVKSFSFTNVMFIIVISVVLSYVIMNYFSSDIVNAYSNRADSMEGAGRRSWRWALGLDNLIVHPMGWSTLQGYQTLYCHNLWLDVSRSAGVIPFIILVYYSYIDVKHFFAVLKDKNKNIVAFILLSYFTVFTLSSFVEPVIDGYFLYFCLYCMVGGCLNQYYKESKNLKYNPHNNA